MRWYAPGIIRTLLALFVVTMLANCGRSNTEGRILVEAAPVAEPAPVPETTNPEPADAIRQLGEDAIVFQDRSVYREVFNLHARASDLSDPAKRGAIVAFLRSMLDAVDVLKANPEPWWPDVSDVIGYSESQISDGWPEMEFPQRIIPDMLDVLETEEAWVAKERDRQPRTREELAQLIDYSVMDEAMSSR